MKKRKKTKTTFIDVEAGIGLDIVVYNDLINELFLVSECCTVFYNNKTLFLFDDCTMLFNSGNWNVIGDL